MSEYPITGQRLQKVRPLRAWLPDWAAIGAGLYGFCLAPALVAQVGTATLNGTVFDPSGTAALPTALEIC